MDGKCVYCGKPIKWKGKLWVTCINCGKMQVWERDGKTTYELWEDNNNGNDL